MTVPTFVDISSANAAPYTVDWQAYKEWSAQADGISRVSLKSSEGAGIVDPFYHAYRSGAEAAGIDMIIHYHYARPDLGNSAQQEADYQAGVIGAIRSRDMVMLDYEGNIQNNPAGFTAEWAYEWLSIQDGRYVRLPTIYSFLSFIQGQLQDSRLAKYPLTFVDPTGDPNVRPAAPAPWSAYTFLQYAWTATTIPGIPGQTDADVYLGGDHMTPLGWKDDGTTLTAPNGVHVVRGFRDYVLSHNWDSANWPLAPEFATGQLEASNTSLGSGTQQLFRFAMLGWSQSRGVFFEWCGQELAFARQQVQKYATQMQQDAAQIAQLQAELAKATAPTGLDPTLVKDRLSAIGLAAANSNTAIQQLVNQPL